MVFAEIYDGETYDAALEIPDWSKAETTKGDWKPVQLVFFDTQVMRAQYAAKVRVMDVLQKRIFKTPAGDTVSDFAQNMAGRIEVTAAGKPGDGSRTFTSSKFWIKMEMYIWTIFVQPRQR